MEDTKLMALLTYTSHSPPWVPKPLRGKLSTHTPPSFRDQRRTRSQKQFRAEIKGLRFTEHMVDLTYNGDAYCVLMILSEIRNL